MERRLRNYTFKRLATPKKRTSEWLRKHPMDCIVWAAGKARKPDDEEETLDGTEEDQDSHAEHLDGTLAELEKEALRTMSFTDVLPPAVDSPQREEENETVMSVDSAEEAVIDHQSSNDILENLKRNMSDTQPHSLRYRQLEHMLKDQERKRAMEENDKRVRHERRKEMLRNRGVRTQNIELLPADPYESMPSPILKDLEKYDEEQRRLEERRRRDNAGQAFEGEWLISTERELHECVLKLTRERDQHMRANWQVYQEVLCDKLKQHHINLGTYNTAQALGERRRVCIEHGLLRKEDQMLVKNLLQPMPQPEVTPKGDSTDEEERFQTQDPSGSNQLPASAVPSSVPDDIAISEEVFYDVRNKEAHVR
ncbi:trichohyalin-like [Montipora capricornis]|uniref:trichohyalin-like n=1 Tax=Montipora capricornis TaxID=246305 RepID=UPI0035F19962